MVSEHIKTLLKGLGYPHANNFSLADRASFQALVFQLEDKYIRSYTTEDRSYLQASASHWDTAFEQYLADVECPITFHVGKNNAEVLEWLLHLAVGLAYEDLGEDGDPEAPTRVDASTSGASFPDWESPDTSVSLQKLLQLLHIHTASSSPTEQILVAKEMIQEQLLPALEESQMGKQTHTPVKQKASIDPSKVSLGFTSNDAEVDSAATVMRLLFIKDLRALQTSIDDAIVEVQEFTQNPRINAKLGLVGR